MSTALYRKYRQKSFSGVIGQEHVVETLKNQIKNGRIGHAYLFTGSRGTGKTTCARIFARAINCLSPKDGSPCGECEVCKALEDASNIDITEIDAASNNGVDDAREIRERVKYPPVVGKYKVYIIDEVHMLTGSAFNALLKTLEEPPSHAVFILATTEVHKLPATILSRCMRFDFRLVSAETLEGHIAKVFDAEGKKYTPDAVRYVADAGAGSVRDALSIADVCLNCSDGELTVKDVQNVLGAADRSNVSTLFDAVATGNLAEIFSGIATLERLGKSMGLIAKELVSYGRDLLVAKTGNLKLIVDSPENVKEDAERAKDLSTDFLTGFVTTLSAAQPELRYSVSPRIVLETACIRAAKLVEDDLSTLSERVARLESKLSGGTVLPTAAPRTESTASSALPPDAKSLWGKLITYMRKNESVRLAALVGNQKNYKISDGKLTVYAENEAFFEFSDPETIAAVKRGFEFCGADLEFGVEKYVGGVDMDQVIQTARELMEGVPIRIKNNGKK